MQTQRFQEKTVINYFFLYSMDDLAITYSFSLYYYYIILLLNTLQNTYNNTPKMEWGTEYFMRVQDFSVL